MSRKTNRRNSMKEMNMKRIINRFRQAGSGFTVLEMVVSISVMTIILMAATPFIKTNVDSFGRTQAAKIVLQSARIGMNRMISEIRNIQETDDLQSWTADELQFEHMVTHDNIRFSLETQDGYTFVHRRVGGIFDEGRPLIMFAEDLTFHYYDKDGNPAASRNDVRKIEIIVLLSYEDFEYELSTVVWPRGSGFMG